MIFSTVKIERVLTLPSEADIKPSQFYAVEDGITTELYFTNSFSELFLLTNEITDVDVELIIGTSLTDSTTINFSYTPSEQLTDEDGNFLVDEYGGQLYTPAILTGSVIPSGITITSLSGNLPQSRVTNLVTDLALKANLSGAAFTGDITVPDEAYGVLWNGSTEVATKNAIYDIFQSLPVLASGIYAPISSNFVEISDATPTEAQYIRVGDVVTVSGRFDVSVNSVEVDAFFELSLPIATSIDSPYYVAGVGYNSASITAGANISGNTSNNTALFKIVVPTSGSLSSTFSYVYTYSIM